MDRKTFNPNDSSFKTSCIKANQFVLAINTMSGEGLFILDDKGQEFLFEGSADNVQIGKALVDCLSVSRRVLPVDDADLFDYKQTDERYKSWVGRLQDFVGFKSKAKLFRPMFSLMVIEQNGTLFIRPSWQKKAEAWNGDGIEDSDEVQIASTSDYEEIGKAVRVALTKCKSVFAKVY